MQNLAVQWHRAPLTLDATFPEEELVALYQTVDVNLSLSQGDVLFTEPMVSADFDQLESRFRPPSQSLATGHVVLTDVHRRGDSTVLGEVFGNTHGLAALYMQNLGNDPAVDSLLAVSAHEIGHLCNLTHTFGRMSSFDSVMLQARDRDEDPLSAWSKANKEARDNGVDSGVSRPADVDCLPFNFECRHRLLQPIGAWGPWTGAFLGLGEIGRDDQLDHGLEFVVHSHRRRAIVGDDIAFVVEVRNRTDGPIAMPLNLHSDFGNLEVVVESEGKLPRAYVPRSLACSHSRLIIEPTSSAFFPAALMDDSKGELIAQPGEYRVTVRARCRMHGARRRARVLKASFEFTADAVAAPAHSVAEARLEGAERASLRLGGFHHRALRGASFDSSLLDAAESPAAPRAVRHAAVLLRASQLSLPQLQKFEELMRKQYPDKEDETLRIKLQRAVQLKERRQ